ncbi:hypothetical protein [Nonomuraea roseola]|uniref:Uncharacterized protein n=1 Tax=Nonomuraea roseola TaxID=46179 RepID=A0ABV5PYA1_9ACTN
MLLEHQGVSPAVDPTAYVAPTATLCGEVRVGPGCRVLFGAVLTAEGGPVERTDVPEDTTVPIGWVAVGDPAELFPPDRDERIWEVQRELDFPGYVFGLPRAADGESIMPEVSHRYGRALDRHRTDRIL